MQHKEKMKRKNIVHSIIVCSILSKSYADVQGISKLEEHSLGISMLPLY